MRNQGLETRSDASRFNQEELQFVNIRRHTVAKGSSSICLIHYLL